MNAIPRGEALRNITVLLLAVVLGMSPWFSAMVVASSMTREWRASTTLGVWLTLAVQLGFVVGSVVSAALLLSDRFSPRRLATWSSSVAAVATAALVIPGMTGPVAVALRGLVGAALAGVYPPGIKIAAGWTRSRRGTAIGALVGGTTLGSAVPHLLRVVADPAAWRLLVLLAAACATLGALLFGTVVREGPFQAPSAPFDPRALGLVLRNRGARLATIGYLGHMWELYAMWSTIGLFWGAVVTSRASGLPWLAPAMAFATVAAGAAGCVLAGQLADRVGRSNVTIGSMVASGTCALVIGRLLHAPLYLLVVVSLVWGFTIVADSAQFSALVTEFSSREFVGTAVTLQTAAGFLLTMVTIPLVPWWSARWGWGVAYMPLALGPLAGIPAMWRARQLERRFGGASG
jgi:MFS family permease